MTLLARQTERIKGRPVLYRMPAIVRALKRGSSVWEISAELEVSVKTVYRDIDVLRDAFGAPAEYDTVLCKWTLDPHWKITLD